jgi:hypothetical protein
MGSRVKTCYCLDFQKILHEMGKKGNMYLPLPIDSTKKSVKRKKKAHRVTKIEHFFLTDKIRQISQF